MFAAVQGLNGMWTGPANKAFTDKFTAEKQMIDDYLAKMEQYVVRLEEDRDAYHHCENRAVGMV